jgi:hypothetical protein
LVLDAVEEVLAAGFLTGALRVVVYLEVVAEEVCALTGFGCLKLGDKFGDLLNAIVCSAYYFEFSD